MHAKCETPQPTNAFFSCLLVDLSQDFLVLEKVVFLSISSLTWCYIAALTSSPTLIGDPPHPGNKTLSPTFTETACKTPSLFGAPGPTAMTVASGSGEAVADEGRKIPVAVFCHQSLEVQSIRRHTVSALNRWTRTRSNRGCRDLMDLNVADYLSAISM